MLTQLTDDSNPALYDVARSLIAKSVNQRITFAEYMDLVLYHPQHGYYATKAINMGRQGDFFTSSHLGADFGEMLAEQFVQMWEILERPVPFTLLELGAGQGLLAADVLSYLYRQYPDFFAALEYVIVERSDVLRQEQEQRLQGLLDIPLPADSTDAHKHKKLHLRWATLEEIPTDSIVGCCFSNELVDALPVHQFTIEGGQIREIYVTTNEKAGNALDLFAEVTDEPSTSLLAAHFDLVKIELPSNAYPEGYRSEVNLAALDWLTMVADRLQHGYLITIDYGYPASRYYSPARQQGTLQCYYQHLRHNNPYTYIGRQDITAHVDFTALELWGEVCGLHKIGFTQQGLFLMALGIGKRIANLSSTTNQARGLASLLQRRDALHQLIDPAGIGGFGVLIQSKRLTEAENTHPLKGLNFSPV